MVPDNFLDTQSIFLPPFSIVNGSQLRSQMMSYTIKKSYQKKCLNVIDSRHLVKRTHSKVIVFFAVNSKLLFKIIKWVKSMRAIKIFVIFSVAVLNLAVVSLRVRFDELVAYAALSESRLEQCRSSILCITETLCEFEAVIRPKIFNLQRNSFKHLLEKTAKP